MATVATIAAACLAFGGGQEDGDDAKWTIQPLRVGDLHRVEMSEQSEGTNHVRNPQTNAVEPVRETLTRSVAFAQRLLPLDDPKAAFPFRTFCLFEKLASQRASQGRELANFDLGPDAKLIVLEPRSSTFPRAWSPRGPLRWSELHTVSYLVFVPALNGLLPDRPVGWGDKWKPSTATLAHLSNFLPVRSAAVECECLQTMQFGGERLLQIAVRGTISGDDPELGPATDELAGGLYIRPRDRTIHSLNLRAKRRIADEKGNLAANWNIDFKLNLRPLASAPAELGDEAVAKLPAVPTEKDLALIAPYPQCAAEIQHPRNWAPGKADGTRFQLLNQARNEEMVVNFEIDGKMPTIEQYAEKVKRDLAAAKNVKLVRVEQEPAERDQGEKGSANYAYAGQFIVRVESRGVERLQIYQVWRSGGRGVTAAASCAPENKDACLRETQFTLRRLRFTAPTLKAGKEPAAAAGN